MKSYISLVLCVVLSGMLYACGASPKNVVVQDGVTTEDILRGEGGQVAEAEALARRVNPEPTTRLVGTTAIAYSDYTRDSVNEIRQLFPTLPNPTILLYVHPHIVVDRSTGESLPVPGYTTAFPLYERVQFALPGELPSSRDPVSTPFPVANPIETGVPYTGPGRTIR